MRYVPAEKKNPEVDDPPAFSFDTTGGTQHITLAPATFPRTAPAGIRPLNP